MYEPFRPAPLRLSGRHYIKEHSASNSSGERNKLKRISVPNAATKPASDFESLNLAMLRRGTITDLACPPFKFPVVIKGVLFPKLFCRLKAF
jgi:hypothetical protein